MNTKACRDLAFSSLAELCVATSILCRDTISIASHFDSHSDKVFWSPCVYVATTISCRDLTAFPFAEFCFAAWILFHDTVSIVSQFDTLSQPPFHVATSYLAFRPHASCDTNCRSVYFLITTWKFGRDNVVSFLTTIPVKHVATLKACRDNSFFQCCRNLIFQSQQFTLNSTSFSGCDLESLSRLSGGPSCNTRNYYNS